MMKSIPLIIVLMFLCSCSFKIAEPKYDHQDSEQAIFTGCIPYSKEPLSFPMEVLVSKGSIEAGSNNLSLFYISPNNEKINVWQYTDYSCVNKITIDTKNMTLKIYYNRSLVRDESFVNILDLKTLKLKEVLLERGQFRI